MPLMWPKQVISSLYKFYDLANHFIGNFSIIGDYLIINNIFLDKAYELSTMNFLVKFIDQLIINHGKRRDPMRQSP